MLSSMLCVERTLDNEGHLTEGGEALALVDDLGRTLKAQLQKRGARNKSDSQLAFKQWAKVRWEGAAPTASG